MCLPYKDPPNRPYAPLSACGIKMVSFPPFGDVFLSGAFGERDKTTASAQIARLITHPPPESTVTMKLRKLIRLSIFV